MKLTIKYWKPGYSKPVKQENWNISIMFSLTKIYKKETLVSISKFKKVLLKEESLISNFTPYLIFIINFIKISTNQ